MCGINGIISTTLSSKQSADAVKKMNAQLAHRGPDNQNLIQEKNVTLGHARLSIIDLSEAGNQPFYSADKKLVVVFNGEIYNYKELKLELQRAAQGSNQKPYFFQTGSDTEVLLAAYIRWGTECLNYLNGMFAFCIYDIEADKCFMARDRVGVKPFYYHYSEGLFIFSSEVRAILNAGVKEFSLNKDVVAEYVQYQTVHAPNTIIKGIKLLLPGNFLELKSGKLVGAEYWNTNTFINKNNPLSYQETCNKVSDLLSQSIQRRLVSDVPLGAFLSGGIDSSIVVGLMAKVSSEKINTFNVSFDESEFSESVYAKKIAEKFNTNHHEIKLSPEHFLNELEPALNAMDHPSGDGPNTYIVSKATKNAGITVALSGIGGDELFAGYANFKRLHSLQNKWLLKATPGFILKSGGFVLKQTKKTIGNYKIAEVLSQDKFDLKEIYPLSRSVFTKKELKKIINSGKASNQIKELINDIKFNSNKTLSAITCMEIKSYLLNVLLRDTDQMSMAVALEVREPFLDYKLIEFVLGVNDEFKMPVSPKKLLTDSIGNLIPKDIINRPKMGFTLPWQHWLKNELKDFCNKNISGLENKKILTPGAATDLWKRFLNNDSLITWSRVWHLIVLNHWLETNKINCN